MKNQVKFVLILFFVLLLFVSCDKFSGDTDSISGSWRCNEESGSNQFRQYTVSIFKAGNGYDSTYYVINNFHNLGNEFETYIQLIDTVITIRDFNGNNAVGKGHVTRDFKTIYWDYNISSENVIAFYFKK